MTDKDYLPQYTAELLCELNGYTKASSVVGNNVAIDRLKGLISTIKDAIHVVLPPNGEIYRDFKKMPTKEELASTFVLPAPITTFEFPIEENFFNKDSHLLVEDFVDESRKEKIKSTPIANVVLVIDYKQCEDTKHYTVLNSLDEPSPPICIHSFWKWKKDIRTGFSWVPSEHVLYSPSPIEFLKGEGNNEWFMTSNVINFFKGNNVRPEDGALGAQVMGSYTSSVDALIQACHSLRVGATLEARKEKSYTRNRVFEKKGVGNFEYHVLKLPHGTVKETLGSRCGSGGDRDGPRYHFRRAHLRNLSKGTQTFVRSCFVGNRDKGVVEKEYKLEKGVAA